MRKGWVLAVVAVVALVAGAVTVSTLDSGGDDARTQGAAGAEPGSATGDGPAIEPAPRANDGPAEGDLKEAAREAHLSTRLARLATLADGRLSPKEGARLTGLPITGPGSLQLDDGRVIVDARLSDAAPSVLTALEQAGAGLLHASPEYLVATLAVGPGDLAAVASVEGVMSLREVPAPIVGSAPASAPAAGEVTPQACGSIISEGDAQLKTDETRSQFSVDGTGVKVGILSDSYNGTSTPTSENGDVASGDLPGEGNLCGRNAAVENLSPGCTAAGSGFSCTDEGRALAQHVHDLAPGASLAFKTAWPSQGAFADNIEALANAGASVIADDINFLDEPFFQDGIVANAVNALGPDVTYLSSAGNSNIGGSDKSSYEAESFRSGGCPSNLGRPSGTRCHQFASGDNAFNFSIAAGGSLLLVLQWSEPWDAVDTDLDLHLTDSSSHVITQSIDPNTDEVPFEYLSYVNTTGMARNVKLLVSRPPGYSGAPRTKLVFARSNGLSGFQGGGAGDVFGPTIFGHAGTSRALSTAAVPYNSASSVEPFSSRGDVTHYWGPVGAFGVPAGSIGEVTIDKPDFAATDGGRTTFFGAAPEHRFFGTSASVAHAAGVVALLKDADPSITPLEVAAVLKDHAVDVGSEVEEAVGAGLLDALASVQSRTGSITIKTDAVADDELDFAFTSDVPGAESFSLDDDSDATLLATKTVQLLPGSYTFTETLPTSPWHLTGLTCDSDDVGSIETGAVTIALAAAENVTCTYTNTEYGSITIEQETLPDDDADFTYSSDIPGAETFTLDDDAVIDDEVDPTPEIPKSIELTDVAPGPYAVSDITAANGFGRESIECNTGEVSDVLLGTLGITLEPGEHVSCVYTHLVEPVDGTIKVVQDSKPDDGQDFDYTVTAPELTPPDDEPQLFTLDDDSEGTAPDLIDVTTDPLGASYEITQTPVPGWLLHDIDCGDDVDPDVPNGTVTIVAPPDETPAGFVCVFSNEKLGSLTVQQDTDPAGSTQAFGYTVSGGPDEINVPFDLDATAAADPLTNTQAVEALSGLRPGTYAIAQIPVAGWSLASIDCGAADVETDLETASVIVELPQDPAVACTFTNDQHGSITVVEDSVPDSANAFTFNVSGGVNQNVTLDDDGSFVTPPPTPTPNTQLVGDLPEGDYTIQRTSGLPTGWSVVSVVCAPDAGTPVTNGAMVHIDPGENVTCTFKHTTRRPDARISTASAMTGALGDGVYNTSGTGQKVSKTIIRKQTKNFYVRFENEGALTGNFMLKGSSGSSTFAVDYFWGSTKVTSQVKAGSYTRSVAGPSDTGTLRIAVRPASTAKKGSSYSLLLTVTSPDGSKDTVKAITYAG